MQYKTIIKYMYTFFMIDEMNSGFFFSCYFIKVNKIIVENLKLIFVQFKILENWSLWQAILFYYEQALVNLLFLHSVQ